MDNIIDIMFFCDKCRYLFNVTKDVKSKQVGGKVSEALTALFDKFSKNEPIVEGDLKEVTMNNLMGDERFENMNKKNQKKMMTTIKSIDKNFFVEENKEDIGSNIAYFICKFCKNYKPIKPGTLIYSKNYNTSSSSDVDDYTYAIYDQTLPRSRQYICKNDNCETHKNDSIKEAVITKNATEQVVYICTICSTSWINAL